MIPAVSDWRAPNDDQTDEMQVKIIAISSSWLLVFVECHETENIR